MSVTLRYHHVSFCLLLLCAAALGSVGAFQTPFRRRFLSPGLEKTKSKSLVQEAAVHATTKAVRMNSTAVGVPTVPSIQQQTIYVPPKALPLVPSKTVLTLAGSVLALNSGFLNGIALGGLLFPAGGPTQAVAACTGAYTNVAVSAATSSQAVFANAFHLGAILSYFAGSCLNGMLCPRGVNWRSRVPTKSLLFSAALVSLVFGIAPVVASPRLCWYLLTIACGVQTSFTSMLISGNLLRSAHFSGMTSDMGTVLGQYLRGNTESAWKLPAWMALVSSFTLGGYVSVKAVSAVGRTALMLPVSLYLLVSASASLRQRLTAKD
ncbi:membrAne [Seminavis robusta]|uniref:MembrAne n=2 Tax=Seminavis robusta TaxID=568900 RepID=A0A9N8DC81_9STRA|nr:membrAne [Seminavis robusta]|eukprot:Sro85_g045290.1 membrAne (322) ;mRNA; r:46527-47492